MSTTTIEIASQDTLPTASPKLKNTKRKYTKLQLKEKTLNAYQRSCLNFPVASVGHYRNWNGILRKKCSMSRSGGRAMAMLHDAIIEDIATKVKEAMYNRGAKRVSVDDSYTAFARYGPIVSVDP